MYLFLLLPHSSKELNPVATRLLLAARCLTASSAVCKSVFASQLRSASQAFQVVVVVIVVVGEVRSAVCCSMISRPSVCHSKDYRDHAIEEPLGGKSSTQRLQILPLSLRFFVTRDAKKKKLSDLYVIWKVLSNIHLWKAIARNFL